MRFVMDYKGGYLPDFLTAPDHRAATPLSETGLGFNGPPQNIFAENGITRPLQDHEVFSMLK